METNKFINNTFRRVTPHLKSLTISVARPIFSAWLLCCAALVCGSVLQTKAQTAGTLDTTYGTAGKVVTNPLGDIKDLALQPDGKIIAGGTASFIPTRNDFVVARYNSNGTMDASFGNAGIATLNFDTFGATNNRYSNDNISAIALQPDGKILAAGYTAGYTSEDYTGTFFAIARFNADGSLDTNFGTNGKIKMGFGSGFTPTGIASLALQPDGKFIAAGGRSSTTIDKAEFALVRYNADGSLESV